MARTKNTIPIYKKMYVILYAKINKQAAAIKYNMDEISFLFIRTSLSYLELYHRKRKTP